MSSSSPATWAPDSWRQKPTLQQPDYPDDDAVEAVLDQLAVLPPLVTSWEVQTLRTQLAEAAHGRRFLLQGGDCAESFADCTAPIITNRLKILLQMSLVLTFGMKTPVVRVGRFAGQYAKPRTSPTQTRGGQTLPSYRGDIINGPAFNVKDRTPDPQRLLQAYSRSALTLNFVRALADAGFADLHHPEYWDLDFVQHSPLADEYRAIVDAIREALHFVESISNAPLSDVERVFFFTSHEALHLRYEQALTRRVPHQPGAYNLATHLPWIGMRTAAPEGAHVEYCRGLANPIGLKVGPGMTPDWLDALLHLLDPGRTPGRLTLIHRFGVDRIEAELPPLIGAVRAAGHPVLWCCDPMHGNTETTKTGRKTRRFDKILAELELAFDLHTAAGSHLGGVHFELTGENVTECTGGARGLADADLEHAYKSRVDPRLNAEQALEMAMRIVRKRRHLGP